MSTTTSKAGNKPIKIAEYRDFHDIPRAFIVRLNSGRILFFHCPFDSDLDDYSSFYNVLLLPPGITPPSDWRELTAVAEQQVATVRVSEMKFDARRKKQAYIPGIDADWQAL